MRLDQPAAVLMLDHLGRSSYRGRDDRHAQKGRLENHVGQAFGEGALHHQIDIPMKDVAARVIIIHRREGFRAHAHSMKLMREAVDEGRVELLTHREVREIHGESCVTAVTIFDNRTDQDETHDVDAVLSLIGFKPDLGPIGTWGLDLERNSIKVNHRLETNLPKVYAAGDIAHYEGKLELIATGFSEAAMAVNHAVHEINPKARYSPGHSTNLKVFKEREQAEEAALSAGS